MTSLEAKTTLALLTFAYSKLTFYRIFFMVIKACKTVPTSPPPVCSTPIETCD